MIYTQGPLLQARLKIWEEKKKKKAAINAVMSVHPSFYRST